MKHNFHQSIEDILATATGEQKLLWNNIFRITGERASVAQFMFTGILAGSELGVYRAGQIYVAYQLVISGAEAAGAAPAYCRMYNEGNVIHTTLANNALAWTGAALNYYPNQTDIQNQYFSRLVAAVYTLVEFIGYRIIYTN